MSGYGTDNKNYIHFYNGIPNDWDESIESNCPVCLKEKIRKFNWHGTYCEECKCSSIIGEQPHRIVRKQREILGFSRKEIGLLFNYSKNTIRQYENHYPSSKYYELMRKLIKEMSND